MKRLAHETGITVLAAVAGAALVLGLALSGACW